MINRCSCLDSWFMLVCYRYGQFGTHCVPNRVFAGRLSESFHFNVLIGLYCCRNMHLRKRTRLLVSRAIMMAPIPCLDHLAL